MTITGLRVISGPAAGHTIALDADVVIGRAERPGGVSFEEDSEMSRRHALFRPLTSGAVLVEDLGSSNGTDVNGQRIEIPRLLALGDEVRVGSSTLRLERIGGEAAGAPVPALDTGRATLSAAPFPPAGPVTSPGPARAEGAPRRWAVALVVGSIGLAVVAFAAGRTMGRSATTTAKTGQQRAGSGMVYLESGASAPGANAIIAYRYQAGGDLQPLAIKEFPTGGAAGFDLTNTGALDADGQIVTTADGRLLFAVNQGSDSVAAFHIQPDGSLTKVAGSPFPSGGTAPAGLGISGSRLVVVNKAQDGVRDLRSATPNVASFMVQAGGGLRPTGSVVDALPGSSPTEALISPDGKVVVVPLEHGPLLSLTMSPTGRLTPAPGSPYALPDQIFPAGFPRSQRWALGLGAQPGGGILYGEAVDTAQLVVYRYDGSGRLRFVRAVADPGAVLPCWTLLNSAGTRLYTDNAGNNTMSVFDLTDPLNPRQQQVVTLKNAGNPWDLRLAPSGRVIFVLDPRDRQDLVPAGGGNELHTLLVNPDGSLNEPDYSPVPIPVPLNVNPIGLAVVGH